MDFTFLAETCFLAILSVSAALANLTVPRNVRVTSLNMGVVLEWDRPKISLGNVTFTAAYWLEQAGARRASAGDGGFVTVCHNQTEPWCDFTAGLHPFGIYVFRVRAERCGEVSSWAKTPEFLPDEQTVIGGPTVRLVSREGNLEMDIQDPVMKVKDLREIYSSVGYNIRYWKEGEEDKAIMRNCKQQNSLVLSHLEASSRYCVQVQVFIGELEKTGEFNQATCETTTSDGRVQAWLITLILVVSLVVVSVALPLLFLVVWSFYKGLKILYPTATLPEHLKRYLMEPPRQLAMQNSSQLQEQYQEVSIIFVSPLVEGGPPFSRTDDGVTEDGEVLPQNEKE